MSEIACKLVAGVLTAVLAAGAAAFGSDQAIAAAQRELSPKKQLAQIRELLDAGSWRQALGPARSHLRENPTDPQAATLLAEIFFRAGQLEQISCLLSSIVEQPDAPVRALLTMARLHAAEGREQEASALLERAVKLAPQNRDLLYHAGDLVSSRSRTIDLLERYLALSEGDAEERITSARGTLGFLRTLGERPVWKATSSPQRLELPLTMLWDRAGNVVGYVVEARIGKKRKPVRLLLDTGTNGLVVIERLAKKRDFEPLALQTLYGGGGSGSHQTERGIFPIFNLGDLQFEDALATSTRQELEETGRFHGLLGLNVFGGYRVTLDLEGKRLILESGGGALEGQPYWKVSGQILVRTGISSGQEGLFVCDTGATSSAVSSDLLEQLERNKGTREITVRSFGGEISGASLVRGVALGFQGLTNGERELVTYDLSLQSRLGGVEVSGLLGLDLLAGNRIEIDTVAQRIRIVRQD